LAPAFTSRAQPLIVLRSQVGVGAVPGEDPLLVDDVRHQLEAEVGHRRQIVERLAQLLTAYVRGLAGQKGLWAEDEAPVVFLGLVIAFYALFFLTESGSGQEGNQDSHQYEDLLIHFSTSEGMPRPKLLTIPQSLFLGHC
jgi:hypothetical protein